MHCIKHIRQLTLARFIYLLYLYCSHMVVCAVFFFSFMRGRCVCANVIHIRMHDFFTSELIKQPTRTQSFTKGPKKFSSWLQKDKQVPGTTPIHAFTVTKNISTLTYTDLTDCHRKEQQRERPQLIFKFKINNNLGQGE